MKRVIYIYRTRLVLVHLRCYTNSTFMFLTYFFTLLERVIWDLNRQYQARWNNPNEKWKNEKWKIHTLFNIVFQVLNIFIEIYKTQLPALLFLIVLHKGQHSYSKLPHFSVQLGQRLGLYCVTKMNIWLYHFKKWVYDFTIFKKAPKKQTNKQKNHKKLCLLFLTYLVICDVFVSFFFINTESSAHKSMTHNLFTLLGYSKVFCNFLISCAHIQICM